MVWPSMPPLDAPLIVSKAGVAAASVGMHVARMSASGWPVPWMALPACDLPPLNGTASRERIWG
jgi:hypothetical protein